MPLPSGADVKIGTREFRLADGLVDDPYEYATEITDTDLFIWDMDDWSGGEGQKYLDVERPDRYWFGQANPRTPGSITSPPDRTQSSALTTSATPERAVFAVDGSGNLWLFVNRQAFYSTNGTTWTAHPSNPIFGAGYQISAATGVGNKVWVSASDGTTRQVLEIDTSTSTTAVSDVTGKKFIGMTQRGGWVFGWTGKNLLRYNSQATLPITQGARHKVYTPFTDTLPSTYYGGAVTSDRSVLLLYSTEGAAVVHEFRRGRGVDVWHLPGLTGKAITHRNGIVYVLTQSNGIVQLHGMGVKTRQSFTLVDRVGEGDGVTTAVALAPGYGNTILILATNGTIDFIYVYDPETDAISQLDQRAQSDAGAADALVTYKDKRISAHFSSTTTKTNAWGLDTATPSSSWQVVSPAWDMGEPYSEKQLLGVHVVQDPTISSGTATVYYQDDEDGVWTSMGSTTGGSKHTYIDIATSNVRARTFRFRVDGTNGCRVYSIAPRFRVASYEEVWRLVVKITDEHATAARPRSRSARAQTLRGYLRNLFTAKEAVTFLDGRRYQLEGGDGVGVSTHTVVLDSLDEFITSTGEGVAAVVLRSTTPT